MAGRGGAAPGASRDRLRRDFPPSRAEESGKRGNNPPSRHLWVGNLSHSIVESDLTDHLLRFGELDSVAFQPGRSYAFINFKSQEDAVEAMNALQGFPVAGNPLRIEFAKADKSSTPSRDEDYSQRRDEQRSAIRGSPFSQRDARLHNASPDSSYPDKSKMSDKNTDPSEVLWIGFPSLLRVDEMILRKAFSPFGEIEKITVFPGRSYAFVRFRSLTSACRAKETLQGKLLGNPRVHICFARSEAGSSNSGRMPLSPRLKSNGRAGSSESFRQDADFRSITTDLGTRSPNFISNLDAGDPDVYGFKRKGTLYPSGSNAYDNLRFEEELGPPLDTYERLISPTRERGASRLYEEPWELPEEPYLLHGAKKQKTGSFPPDKELPGYPFLDVEQEKRAFERAFDKNFEGGPFGHKSVPNYSADLTLPHADRSDNWRASYVNPPSASDSPPSNPVQRKRFTPEPEQPSLNLWKWEGTIAKGGTPVCNARCFPVGKAMDFMLPEFLNCTARTGLDMLAKHYYQAASAWVVFFVPANDTDIGYYNEFMNYLGEKQRAAVAKLNDKTTLFLVPPSDFSEKVLRVPGKMSISGVVLRLEHPGSNMGPPYHPNENRDTNFLPFHGDSLFPKPSTTSSHFPSITSRSDSGRSGGDHSFLGSVTSAPPVAFSGSGQAVGSLTDSFNDNRHEYPLQQQNPMLRPNWSPHDPQNISGNRYIPSASNADVNPVFREHQSVLPRRTQENSSINHAGLQPQQLAQLAASLLGQQRQSGSNTNVSSTQGASEIPSSINQADSKFRMAQGHHVPSNQVSAEISTSQFGLQQQQLTSDVQRELPPGSHGNPQVQSAGSQEESDGDPQKRLQATLQLAAALLQQIQHGKGT